MKRNYEYVTQLMKVVAHVPRVMWRNVKCTGAEVETHEKPAQDSERDAL